MLNGGSFRFITWVRRFSSMVLAFATGHSKIHPIRLSTNRHFPAMSVLCLNYSSAGQKESSRVVLCRIKIHEPAGFRWSHPERCHGVARRLILHWTSDNRMDVEHLSVSFLASFHFDRRERPSHKHQEMPSFRLLMVGDFSLRESPPRVLLHSGDKIKKPVIHLNQDPRRKKRWVTDPNNERNRTWLLAEGSDSSSGFFMRLWSLCDNSFRSYFTVAIRISLNRGLTVLTL